MFPFFLIFALTCTCAVYDQATATKFYYTSLVSYCNSDAATAWNCNACKMGYALTNVAVLGSPDGSSNYIVGQSAELNAVVVALKVYSEVEFYNTTKLLTNARENYPHCRNCKINKYIWSIYGRDRAQILDAIKQKRKGQFTKVAITGFSLGGSAANLLLVDLFKMKIPVSHTYTFGASRVGGINFMIYVRDVVSKWIDDGQIFRVTQAADYIPSALNINVLGYYHHAPHEIFYPGIFSQGYQSCNDGLDEDISCSYKYYKHNWDDHVTYFNENFYALIKDCQLIPPIP